MDRAYGMHGRQRNVYRIFVGKREVKRPLRKYRINGRTGVIPIVKKLSRRAWIGLICQIGTSDGSLRVLYRNVHLGSIKCGKCIE
jgi:hypothetical protein